MLAIDEYADASERFSLIEMRGDPPPVVEPAIPAPPPIPPEDIARARKLIDGLTALAVEAGLVGTTWCIDNPALHRAAATLAFTSRHTAGHGTDAFDVLYFGGLVTFYGPRVSDGGTIVAPEDTDGTVF